MLRRELYCLAVIAAVGPSCFDDTAFAVEPVELGVDVRLEAVTYDYRRERLYLVGSGGLVLDDIGHQRRLSASLRDIARLEGSSIRDPRLIVVGANGFVAIAQHPDGAEDEFEFEVETVGTDADLWAVAAERHPKVVEIVIVGDDALLVGREDDQGELVWTHPSAPAGGWGRLRDVKLEPPCAIGRAGRMLCATNDELDHWEIVELDTDANLNSFCSWSGMVAVGDGGVFVTRGHPGYSAFTVQPPVDILACTNWFYDAVVVGADRTIYQLDPIYHQTLETRVELDWQPRAVDPQFGAMLVGDNGRAGYLKQTAGLRLQ